MNRGISRNPFMDDGATSTNNNDDDERSSNTLLFPLGAASASEDIGSNGVVRSNGTKTRIANDDCVGSTSNKRRRTSLTAVAGIGLGTESTSEGAVAKSTAMDPAAMMKAASSTNLSEIKKPSTTTASTTTNPAVGQVQIPFGQRPYGSSMVSTLKNDEKLETSRYEFIKNFYKYRESARRMPGHLRTLLLQELECPLSSDETSTAVSSSSSEPSMASAAAAATPTTTDNADDGDDRKLSQPRIRPPTKYSCFSLWDTQQHEGNNLQQQHTFDAMEQMSPLLKGFPKIHFWVQVDGTHLDQKKKETFGHQHHNTMQAIPIYARGIVSSSSSKVNKDEEGLILESDLVVITKWNARGAKEMDPTFQYLQNLKLHACHNLVPPPESDDEGSFKQEGFKDHDDVDAFNPWLEFDDDDDEDDSKDRKKPAVHDDNDDDQSDYTEHTCKMYEIYLTHNQDNPNEYMEFTVWSSLESYRQFYDDPHVKYTYELIRSKFGHCSGDRKVPEISFWKNIETPFF